MILLLLFGVALFGLTIVLVVHAVAVPRLRAEASVARIGAYGFPVDDAGEGGPSPLSATIDRIAERIGGAMLPRFTSSDQDDIRLLMASAGVYDTEPSRFLGYRALAALGFLAGWLLLGPAVGMATPMFLLLTPFTALMGWTVPLSLLRVRGQRRLAEIDSEMPEMVDSLVVTVEAGAGFGSALRIAGERLTGPLGDEIQLTLQEQDMGLGIEIALENLHQRVPTRSMRSFVRAVLQAETMGVSIGEILRSLAVEMRARKRATAEEQAQKAPVKMLFPLVFCIFPSLLIILLYPAMSEFLKAF